MKKKIVPILCVFAAMFQAFCAKLDSFEKDFEFVYKNCGVVERLDTGAAYRQDFKLRLFKLQADANDIQKVATEIGIRDIEIGTHIKNLISTIGIQKKTFPTRESLSIRNFAANDTRRQIRYLKDLHFSYEDLVFTPNKVYRDDLNVQIRFSRRWEHCKNLGFSKRSYSRYAIEQYRKRYFKEIDRLARMIEQKVRNDKISIPKEFQLAHHVSLFVQNWETNAKFFESNTGINTRINITPEITSRIDEMKLIAVDIEKDLDLLAASGFSMMLPDSKFIREKEKEMIKRNRALQKENLDLDGLKNPEKKQTSRKKKTETPRLSREKLVQLYNQKKQTVYGSESRMNGVSEKLYREYRDLLPERQRQEMDRFKDDYLKQSYPEPLARATAVKKTHLKYEGNKHGCTDEELIEIMNINPGDVQK